MIPRTTTTPLPHSAEVNRTGSNLARRSCALESGKSEIMRGNILLEGGAEFGGQMAEPDRRAIELAGGVDAPVSIIPTAAAPDHNHQRAGQTGVRWFSHLRARQVTLLPLIDQASANQPFVVTSLINSRFI